MKVALFCCLLAVSGCSKVANIANTQSTETESTGDPIYDKGTEVKVLVPWTWVI